MAEENKTEVTSDAALVSTTLETGSGAVFGELVTRHKGMVMGLVYSIVRDHHEAEDLAQEAFVRAFRSLKDLRNRSQFALWLGSIARNVALRGVSRKRPSVIEQTYLLDGEDTGRPEGSKKAEDPGKTVSKQETYDSIFSAIESLPETYRSTVYMKYQKGLTCREIAEVEGVSVGVVTSRLSRSMTTLREKLSSKMEGGEE